MIATLFCCDIIKTRRIAIANGTCVNFCNQPKAHYLATSRESRRYIVAFCRWGCWNLATSRESKAHFGLPWVRPWDYRGKCTWIEREFNSCQTPSNMYPSIFNRLWAIARYWSEIATFSYPLACWRCSHWNSGKNFGPQKTRIMWLPGSEDRLTIGWAILTQYQRVTDGQTDRLTDGRPAYSYYVLQHSWRT